ncbi:hypothetical protein FA15DRAFT_698594, partial [Coprinopsis marcescibilis]
MKSSAGLAVRNKSSNATFGQRCSIRATNIIKNCITGGYDLIHALGIVLGDERADDCPQPLGEPPDLLGIWHCLVTFDCTRSNGEPMEVGKSIALVGCIGGLTGFCLGNEWSIRKLEKVADRIKPLQLEPTARGIRPLPLIPVGLTPPDRSRTSRRRLLAHTTTTPSSTIALPPTAPTRRRTVSFSNSFEYNPLDESPTFRLRPAFWSPDPATSPDTKPPMSRIERPDFKPMAPQLLPSKYEHKAPRWNGEAETLENFWDELETLFREFEVEPANQVDAALRYAPGQEVRFWKDAIKELVESDRVKWEVVKPAISQIYPGATPETRGYDDLVNLPKLATISELGKNLGTWQKSQMLIAGIPQPLRERVERQLRLISPAHMPGTPWKIEEITTAAKIVLAERLERRAFNFLDRDEPSTPDSSTRAVFDSSKQSSSSNSFQIPDMEALASIISATVDKVLAAKAASLSVSAPQQSPATYPNNIQQSYPPRPRPDGCIFCSEQTHFIRGCPLIEEYITKKLCLRNQEYKICLPNGTPVTTRLAGRNMKERIDNWNATNPASHQGVAMASVHLVTITPHVHAGADIRYPQDLAPVSTNLAQIFPLPSNIPIVQPQLSTTFTSAHIEQIEEGVEEERPIFVRMEDISASAFVTKERKDEPTRRLRSDKGKVAEAQTAPSPTRPVAPVSKPPPTPTPQ